MTTPCANHPHQRALYCCLECGRRLCAACLKTRDAGSAQVKVCASCDGSVEMLAPDEAPFSAFAGQILVAPFTRSGLIILLAGALICALTMTLMHYNIIPLINLIAYAIVWCVFAAYVCLVINRAASGRFEVPQIGDITDWWDDLAMPGLRLLAAYATVAAPVVIYLIWFKSWNLDPDLAPLEMARTLVDPLILVLLLVGLLYMPMATLIAAVESSLFAVLNPVLVIVSIVRVLGAYLLTALVFYGILIVSVLANAAITVVFGLIGDQVFLPLLCEWFLDFLVWYYAGSVLGGLLYTYGERFGMSHLRRKAQRQELIAALPQVVGGAAATPTAAAGAAGPSTPGPGVIGGTTEAPGAPRHAPIALDEQPAAANADLPLEATSLAADTPGPQGPLGDDPFFDPDQAPAPAAPSVTAPTPAAVAALVAEGDLNAAADGYLGLLVENRRHALPPDAQYAVARQLEGRGQITEAVEAYRKFGALFADHPRAPAALYQAATLTFRQLRDSDQAVQTLKFLLARYPDSAAALQAREVLRTLERQTTP